MPQDRWTIHNDPDSPPIGNDLNGLHIVKSGSRYELKEHNVHNPLTSVNAAAPPFQFPSIVYDGLTWIITVLSLPIGANGSGSWKIPAGPGDDPADGEFTAQAGSGLDEDEDEDEAASSAYA